MLTKNEFVNQAMSAITKGSLLMEFGKLYDELTAEVIPSGYERCEWADATQAWTGLVMLDRDDEGFQAPNKMYFTLDEVQLGLEAIPLRLAKPEARVMDGWKWEAKEKVEG